MVTHEQGKSLKPNVLLHPLRISLFARASQKKLLILHIQNILSLFIINNFFFTFDTSCYSELPKSNHRNRVEVESPSFW